MTGRIFDIQRFSVHDGPGIRTIVFLKGCPFRCKWCCNPESQEFGFQTMQMNGKVKQAGRDVTVEEVMKIIRKDQPYYHRSGGGVTLSGGEFLAQSDFARELLMTCKNEGYHTAVESTAGLDFEIIEKVLPYIDQYLMDIKHMNPKKHAEFTGRSNELILENARKIAASDTELIIRVPVVPTFNATKEEIHDIAAFAATLPGVKELHLLPYHRYGEGKYEALGRPYEMAHIKTMSDEEAEILLLEAKKSGLTCQIGG